MTMGMMSVARADGYYFLYGMFSPLEVSGFDFLVGLAKLNADDTHSRRDKPHGFGFFPCFGNDGSFDRFARSGSQLF